MVEPRATPPNRQPQPLPDFSGRTAVAEFLGLSLSQLAYWTWVVRGNRRYKRFSISKRNGKPRYIDAPVPPLKEIQRKLARALTDGYKPPTHVHGFTQKRSPLTNADVHIKQAWVFSIDLEDFFPTITLPRVRGMFRNFPFDYPDDVAELLAELCCHEQALPQGAPTSPIISNYLCRGMDRKLGQLALSNSCLFSRYADDLVFSTDRRVFPTAIAVTDGGLAKPGPRLQGVITEAGFHINPKKTRMQSRIQRQRVTGLIVNKKRNLSRDYIRGVRALLYIWKVHGPEDAASSLRRASPDPNWPPGKPYPSLASVVRGRLQYIGSVRGSDDPLYLKLAEKLAACDPHFEVRRPVVEHEFEAHLYTEGITDVRHVRAALEHFHEAGEFKNLKLIFDEETDRGDDKRLAEHCFGLRDFGSDELAVCLFDSDTKTARDAVGEHGWQLYGSKVVAVGLVAPSWRDPHEKLCIEMLYEDSVLQTKDDGGRRIYLTNEFHPATTIHKTEQSTIPRSGGDSLIATKVYGFGSENNLARSKAHFANAIEEDPESFAHLSFEGFRPTFQRIVSALKALPVDPSQEA